MVVIQLLVMLVEVTFLYRPLVSALSPWAGAPLHPGATLALAAVAWLGTRATTWFLFARYGTEPLLAVIARRPLTPDLRLELTTPFAAHEPSRNSVNAP